MRNILKTTLATTFAVACISGASMAFAADNGGGNNGGQHSASPSKSMNDNDSDVLPTDPNTTGSVTCDNNSANMQSGCDDTNGTNNGAQQQ